MKLDTGVSLLWIIAALLIAICCSGCGPAGGRFVCGFENFDGLRAEQTYQQQDQSKSNDKRRY